MKPIVVLVGRPNVGKSTFFNRVTRSRRALVDDMPGVTRDRLYADARWGDTLFTIVDTGGFAGGREDDISRRVGEQLRRAMADADAIVLMFDGRAGVTPFDAEMLEMLRGETKPVLFAVNKVDGPEQEDRLFEFHELGLEQLYPVSAQHGFGVNDFLDALTAFLPPAETGDESGQMVRVAVVGRPNVGKSSLINRLLGEERMLVSETAGTTRDAVDIVVERRGKPYCLVDTAGIRRKARVSRKLEKFSVIRALKSLDRCDVALILMDASEGITDQDIRIAGYAEERGCGCVLLFNKWDLVEKEQATERQIVDELRGRARHLGFAPAMTISARTGLRVSKIFQRIDDVFSQYDTRIPTGRLNRILEQALERNEPSLYRGRRIRFYYATQAGVRPPTFVFFVNYPEAVHFSYRRYLVNQIREQAGLDRTPVRVYFRKRKGKK
jgi:GTP-binding protein